MYEAYMKRKITEQLEARKMSIISGLYGNGNADGKTLSKILQDIEREFGDAVYQVWTGKAPEEEELDTPFFKAMKVAKPPEGFVIPDAVKPSASVIPDVEYETDQD